MIQQKNILYYQGGDPEIGEGDPATRITLKVIRNFQILHCCRRNDL
jgi:hypothetical protein